MNYIYPINSMSIYVHVYLRCILNLFRFLNMLTKDANSSLSPQAVYGLIGAIGGFLTLVSLLIFIVIAVYCHRVNKALVVSE